MTAALLALCACGAAGNARRFGVRHAAGDFRFAVRRGVGNADAGADGRARAHAARDTGADGRADALPGTGAGLAASLVGGIAAHAL